ncbi:MAG: putative alkylated repair protein [Frankiales bacterium]|nr:putative alkylated repair protein [Frankiales bacterium]
MLAWQDSLFDQSSERLSFDGVRRDALSATSWVDVVPGWLPEHEQLFGWLLQHADWHQRSRVMWEQEVLEPRLTAFFDGGLPPALEELRLAVSDRYAVEFDSCLVNLYRDGNDAVAWHGDSVRKTMLNPLVVTVSLGSARRFLVRRRGGGPVLKEYAPGHGDLMVMGGAMQHSFEHAVPRQPHASGARMSVTMRHSHPVGPAG